MFNKWKKKRLLKRLDKDIQAYGEETEAYVLFNEENEMIDYSIEILHIPIEDEETFNQIAPFILSLADIRLLQTGEIEL